MRALTRRRVVLLVAVAVLVVIVGMLLQPVVAEFTRGVQGGFESTQR